MARKVGWRRAPSALKYIAKVRLKPVFFRMTNAITLQEMWRDENRTYSPRNNLSSASRAGLPVTQMLKMSPDAGVAEEHIQAFG